MNARETGGEAVPDSPAGEVRKRLRALPVAQGLLPIRRSQVPADLLAGVTLAAVSIPVVLGYAKIEDPRAADRADHRDRGEQGG